MKLRNLCFVIAVMLYLAPVALAYEPYLDLAKGTYPSITNTALDSCVLCHLNPAGGGARNPFGEDFKTHGHSFATIEGLDSDADNFTNMVEIDALTFPGDASSVPAIAGTIKVKKPNGGETWTIGTKALVTWTSTGDIGADVSIELWQNGHKVKKLKGSTPNDGKQKIKLKAGKFTAGDGYTVKVKSVADPSISDESDASFSIAP